MKGILIITHEGELNGSNNSLLPFLKQQLDYNIFVITPKNSSFSHELKTLNKNINIIHWKVLWSYIKYPNILIQCAYEILFIINGIVLLMKLRNKEINLVYTNSSVTLIGVFIANFLKVPNILHVRELIEEHFNKHYLHHFLNGYLSKSDTNIIYNSYYVQNKYINRTIISNKKIIYNSIDYDVDIPKYKELNTAPESVIKLGIIGNIYKAKNQIDGIFVLSKLKQKLVQKVKLQIVGSIIDSKYFTTIESKVNELGLLESFEYIPFVKNIKFIYKQLDFLLNFSKNEGFGRVNMEAMYFGIPVFVRKESGFAEIISNGQNGFIFNDFDEICVEIIKLVNNKEEYSRISKNSVKYINEKLNSGNYLDNLSEFIKKCLMN